MRRSIMMCTAAGLALLPAAPAAAQSGGRNEYAVKYVCGTNAPATLSPAAAPGTYYTAINVHNPSGEAVPFVYKVVIAPTGGPGGHTPLTSPFRIGEDGATDVDCTMITRALDGPRSRTGRSGPASSSSRARPSSMWSPSIRARRRGPAP
jgi:hypothetical protein